MLFLVTMMTLNRFCCGDSQKFLYFGENNYKEILLDPNDDQNNNFRSILQPNPFPTPDFDSEGRMDFNWTLETPQSQREAKFELKIIDFARDSSLTTVRIITNAIVDYKACEIEGNNETFATCTNASYGLEVLTDLSGTDEWGLLTIFNIFDWASGRTSWHQDVTRFDALHAKDVFNLGNVVGVTTDLVREEIKCDNQTNCHQHLLPCEKRKRTSKLDSTDTWDVQVEEGDVVHQCCQCYPGKKRWRCDGNGRKESMEKAKIDFENSAQGDCNQPDSLGKARNFGNCPYFCECGECFESQSDSISEGRNGGWMVTPKFMLIFLSIVSFHLLE